MFCLVEAIKFKDVGTGHTYQPVSHAHIWINFTSLETRMIVLPDNKDRTLASSFI